MKVTRVIESDRVTRVRAVNAQLGGDIGNQQRVITMSQIDQMLAKGTSDSEDLNLTRFDLRV